MVICIIFQFHSHCGQPCLNYQLNPTYGSMEQQHRQDQQNDVSLPWLWAIEALARLEQVDISFLHDLILRAPEFSDNLGKKAREMVALRCLEDMFGPSNGIRSDGPSIRDLKFGFNLSESCEDVLQRILHEMSISDLRMARPELLKWDISPFLTHKRDSLPKCDLEQLKDTILDGTHPYAAFLRERCGLLIENECHNMNHMDDGDPKALSCGFDGNDTDQHIEAASRKGISLTSENGNGFLQEDSPDRILLSIKRERSDSLTSENGNIFLQEDPPNKILLPVKRQRSESANKNLAGQLHELSTENDGDLHLNAKKSKQGSSSTIQSVGHDLVPLHRNEQGEDPSGRTILDTEKQGCDFTKESQAGGLEGTRVSEDVHNEYVSQKRIEKSSDVNDDEEGTRVSEDVGDESVSQRRIEQSNDVNDDEVQHNQLQSWSNNELIKYLLLIFKKEKNNELPKDTSGDGPYENISVDGAKGDIGECCAEPKTSTPSGNQQKNFVGATKDNGEESFQLKTPIGASPDGSNQKMIANEAEDNVEHCSEEESSSDSDGFGNEQVDVATKKHSFLSSQSSFSQDSLSTTDSMEKNLCMKCNKDGQLLACSASACPLVVHEKCVGSSASFDNRGNFYCPFCAYSLAISEYLESKKIASIARKELAAFVGMGFKHQREKRSERFPRKNEQNEDVNLLVQSYGNVNSREEDRLANHNGEHVNQIGEEENRQADHDGVRVNEVDIHQIRESTDDKQQAEPPVPCVNDHLSCREEEATEIRGALCASTEEKRGGKMFGRHQYVGGLEAQQNQVPADCEFDGDNSCFRDEETILVSWRRFEVGNQQEVLQQQVTGPPREPACEPNVDVEETSEDENDKSIVSNYSLRFRSQEKHYTYPAIPFLRRKKAAWTAEEEDILKEGVQRFSSVKDRSIPWKQILEFGGTVFWRGRTPVDLKDKWRNICKGSPKLN